MNILVHWVLSALVFLVLAKLPIGVKIDGFVTALWVALVFGALNSFVKPVLTILTLPVTLLTLGLFLFVLNAAIFGLTAWLVPGMKLVYGFWSALWGAIAFSFLNWLVGRLF